MDLTITNYFFIALIFITCIANYLVGFKAGQESVHKKIKIRINEGDKHPLKTYVEDWVKSDPVPDPESTPIVLG